MRVLVACGPIGGLPAAAAAAAIASGWSRTAPQTQLAVVPLGEAGEGIDAAVADLLGTELTLLPGDRDSSAVVSCVRSAGTVLISVTGQPGPPWQPGLSSLPLGRALAQALRDNCDPPRRIVVDLGGGSAHDAGAGILAGLGAVADRPLDAGPAALAGIGRLDLDPVRRQLAGAKIDLIVPGTEVGRHLLGLRGVSSLRGREAAVDRAEMLDTDAALGAFAAAMTRAGGAETAVAAAGAGACGVAYALTALGAQVTTGSELIADLVALSPTLAAADLIITGCTTFDFASRGGGAVATVARWAAASMSPAVLLAGEVLIGAREQRTLGIEAAYPVYPASFGATPPVSAEQLAALAARVARSWFA